MLAYAVEDGFTNWNNHKYYSIKINTTGTTGCYEHARQNRTPRLYEEPDWFKKPVETGKWEGKREERTEANREFTIQVATNTDFDDVKIASLAGVDVAWVVEIRKELKK